MLLSQVDLDTAFHWWTWDHWVRYGGKVSAVPEAEREALSRAQILLPSLFQAIDSLYTVTRDIPSPWASTGISIGEIGATKNIVMFNIPPLNSQRYLLLRTVLFLTNDVIAFSKPLKDLQELDNPLKTLTQAAKRFKDIRNFFTHLDERLSNLSKHGITGAIKTNCGIEYTSTAQGCFHLILIGDELHYSSHGEAKEINVGRSAFDPVFEGARLVYSEITSHKLHKRQYPTADQIYPL